MNTINVAALDATAYFVIFGVIGYMGWQFSTLVLKIARDFHPRQFLDYPLMALAVFSAAVQLVAAKHRLDEYSLSSGLVAFGLAAALGLNPRPACAVMILMIALFNTVRPQRKKATQPV